MGALDATALAVANNYETSVVPYVTGPCTAMLLEYARPEPGEWVVDVATGTGVVAHTVAPVVSGMGRVVAVDIDPAMLEVGREKPPPRGAKIEWLEGDARDLPLPRGEFDLALCHHGLQYIPHGTAALAEMHRVLRRGGRLALSVWRTLEHNPFAQAVYTCIARRLELPPETFALPFACGDAGEVQQMLEETGFQDVQVVPCSVVIRQPRPADYLATIMSGARKLLPALDMLGEAELAPLVQRVEEECGPLLASHTQDGDLVYPLSLHVATGRA